MGQSLCQQGILQLVLRAGATPVFVLPRASSQAAFAGQLWGPSSEELKVLCEQKSLCKGERQMPLCMSGLV